MNNSTCSAARHLWGAGFLVVGLTLSMPCPAQPKYNVTNLGTLGPWWSRGTGINSNGQVAGSSPTGSGLAHAFRTASNASINPLTDDLGTLAGSNSQASGINKSGQVVGICFFSDESFHSFRTAANAGIHPATDDLGNVWATGINSAGQVVGFDFNSHGFRTAPNAAVNLATDNLGSLGGGWSQPYALNDAGQAVGFSSNGRTYHAFRTGPNAAIHPATDDLSTLGGSVSGALGVNATGQAVGWSTVSLDGYLVHAFRTGPNSAIRPGTDDLGTLGGAYSVAEAINSSGQVVGWAELPPPPTPGPPDQHAFVYSGGLMQDLNRLIPAGSGWVLREASAINDSGQIVGVGDYNGVPRAFRLDPITPAQAIGYLIQQLAQLALPAGTTNSLNAKLEAALRAVQSGNTATAANHLRAFLNEVAALRNTGRLDAAPAASLLSAANGIIDSL